MHGRQLNVKVANAPHESIKKGAAGLEEQLPITKDEWCGRERCKNGGICMRRGSNFQQVIPPPEDMTNKLFASINLRTDQAEHLNLGSLHYKGKTSKPIYNKRAWWFLTVRLTVLPIVTGMEHASLASALVSKLQLFFRLTREARQNGVLLLLR